MRKTWKTLMAALLVLVMCVTLLPVQAFAISAADYEKKYCKVNSTPARAKILVSSVQMWSLPATSSQESSSTKLTTISKDARVQVSKLIYNNNTNIQWWCVTYSGKTGYIYCKSSGSSGDLVLRDSFLEDCTTYVSHVSLKTTAKTTIKSMPCAAGTDYNSKDVVTLPSGSTATATQLLKNVPGNYWYKVSCTYNGTSYEGYMYAGDATPTAKYDVSVASVTAPSAEMTVGSSLTLKGKVTSSVLPLSKVGAFVYSGSATSGTAATGGWATTTAKSFEIKGSAADTKCKIGSLSAGSYTYTIKAVVNNNWSTDGTSIKTENKTLILYTKAFTELNTYKIQYNANGGTGAPSAQTKTQGKTLTLSSTKPTRAAEAQTPYTVTLNANGGSVSTTSLSAARTTSYAFLYWNTKADGSGTTYQPGGKYTANAAATL